MAVVQRQNELLVEPACLVLWQPLPAHAPQQVSQHAAGIARKPVVQQAAEELNCTGSLVAVQLCCGQADSICTDAYRLAV